MSRRNSSPSPDGDFDTVVDAKLEGLRVELKWQRWALTALAGVVGLPKMGGPDLPAAVIALGGEGIAVAIAGTIAAIAGLLNR